MRQKFIKMVVRKIKKLPIDLDEMSDISQGSDEEQFPDIMHYKNQYLGDDINILSRLMDDL